MLRLLFIGLLLTSCASSTRPYGGSYRKAYKDRECNHSHICCEFDCPCCDAKIKDIDQQK